MATLFLKRYPDSSSGKFIDGTAQDIEESLISDEILNMLGDLKSLPTLQLYGDTADNNFSAFPCITGEWIDLLRKQIEEKFVNSRSHPHTHQPAKDELENEILNMRVMTNVFYLLWLKETQYGEDEFAILQLEM
ncbi:hypothetical protein QUC30_11815 [Aeromonas caviae]|uniref:hypothetical protein n=1 Tax=Aeromonas caviae TaxID=648 RepID=UPI003A495D2B